MLQEAYETSCDGVVSRAAWRRSAAHSKTRFEISNPDVSVLPYILQVGMYTCVAIYRLQRDPHRLHVLSNSLSGRQSVMAMYINVHIINDLLQKYNNAVISSRCEVHFHDYLTC
jgi:hypothetical protein